MSSAAPKQPQAFPEPKNLLNQPAAHLLDSDTYYSDGYLYSFYKNFPPLEAPPKDSTPRTVTFYILDQNL